MRIMLDECLTLRASRLVIEALALHKPPITAEFLEEHFKPDGSRIGKGAWDVDWTGLLAQEGDWVVLTCDTQRPKGQKARLKGPPLHLILPARKITGFFMGGSLASASGFEKLRAIIYLMPEILERADARNYPAGTRFRILSRTTGRAKQTYDISEWPLSENLPPDFPNSLPPPHPPPLPAS